MRPNDQTVPQNISNSYFSLDASSHSSGLSIKERLKKLANHKILNSIFKSLVNTAPLFCILLAYEKLSAPSDPDNSDGMMLVKICAVLIIFLMYLPIFIYEKNQTDTLEKLTKQIEDSYESSFIELDEKQVAPTPSSRIGMLKANLCMLTLNTKRAPFDEHIVRHLIQQVESQCQHLTPSRELLGKKSYRSYKYHKTKIGFLHYALNFSLALLSGVSTSFLINRGDYRLIKTACLVPGQDQTLEVIAPFNPNLFDVLALIANGLLGAMGSLLVTKETARAIIDGYESHNQSIFKIEEDINEIRTLMTTILEALETNTGTMQQIYVDTCRIFDQLLHSLTGVGLEANNYVVVLGNNDNPTLF